MRTTRDGSRRLLTRTAPVRSVASSFEDPKFAASPQERLAAQQIADTLRGMMKERDHQFSLLLPDTAVEIFGDAMRLQQILGNLLTNAARYTPPGGRIGLSISAEGAEAVVRVTDNGIGIPPNKLATIFELFTQAHSDYAESQGGLGIGLTLARELVTLHDGTIQARSEGLGRGSEFTARFPLSSPTRSIS